MELHNKLSCILKKGISLTKEEIQELNLHFNIFDIIEKEKVAFGNFLLSDLRSNQNDQVGDWDLRNHEYYRKMGVCESIKRMYQNQQDVNIALVYYTEGNGYESEFPDRWSDALKKAKEISKDPKCHYVGISNTKKMTVFFSSEEFTEMAKYYNGWFQTEKDHETFIKSVYDCFKTKKPQTFEFNKMEQNMNQSKTEIIDNYYKAAKFAEQEGIIKSLKPDGTDEFHFYHKSDKCLVSVYEEDGLISMTQDYEDGNAPDTDDISLSGFKKYLEIDDIYQDVDVYKNKMFHQMPFGFADPGNGGMVGQSDKLNQASMKQIEMPNTNIIVLGFGMDVNGNKVIKLKYPNPSYSAFSFQVDSYDYLRFMSRFDLNDVQNDTEKVEKALVSVIEEFGSKKQKEGLRKYKGFNESMLNQSEFKLGDKFLNTTNNTDIEIVSIDDENWIYLEPIKNKKGLKNMAEPMDPNKFNKFVKDGIYKRLDESLSVDQLKSIDKFLAEYPDDATSWRQATDEIATVYVDLMEEYNEIAEKDLDVINPLNTKTPGGRNKEYKKGIYFFLELMKKDPKFSNALLEFYEDKKEWFTN